jgi:CBS domain-containing protein
MAERDRNDQRNPQRGAARGEGRASAFQGDYGADRTGGRAGGRSEYGAGRGEYAGRGDYGTGRGDYGGGRDDYGVDRGGSRRYGQADVGEQGLGYGRAGSESSRWDEDRWADQGHYGHAGGGSDFVGPTGITGGRGKYGDRSEYGGYGSSGIGYASQESWDDQRRGSGRGSRTEAPYGSGDWGNQGYGVPPHLLIGSGREGEREGSRNRGPKGWQRSDDRIHEDVCERMMGESGVDPSDVTVRVAQGVVTLTGTVPNRQMKYRIEELADRCPGVKDVENQVRVNRIEGGLFGGGSSSSSGRSASRGGLLGRLFGFSTGSRIADVMTRNPQVVSPSDTVAHVAKLMKEHDVGAIPVCDGTRLVGMITDRDVTIRSVAEGKQADQVKVDKAMTSKVHWCYEDDEVEDVLEKMGDLQIRRIPVVDRDKHLVGIVALGDLSRHDAGEVQDALGEISERR